MKRKLISYDVFESIQNDSLSSLEFELVDAENVLARALGTNDMSLVSFGPETALYETADGLYVYAGHKIDGNVIKFENIQQLVIDEDTEKNRSKEIVGKILDSLLEDKKDAAEQLFNDYIGMPAVRRNIKEGLMPKVSVSTGTGRKSKFRGKRRAGGHAAAMKAGRTRKRHERSMPLGLKMRAKRLREIAKKKLAGRPQRTGKGQRHVRTYIRFGEWASVSNNVLDYVDFQVYGPILAESQITHDESGNVVSVTMPTSRVRNEGKVLSFDWKTLKTDVKVLREQAHNLIENSDFCKAVAELKRHNALSDSKALEEALEDVVTNFPEVLYLTEGELAGQINLALESTGVTNYDDQTCKFMAEGILRTAHNAYVDRVTKVVRLAGSEIKEDSEDKYAAFKTLVDDFYPSLDESFAVEMQVFVDLYEALCEIYDLAEDDDVVRKQTADHLHKLSAIIQKDVKPNIDIAEEAAIWLSLFAETNLETQTWNPDGSPVVDPTFDHPDLKKHASKSYSPAADGSGNWGGVGGPMSDGKRKTDNSELSSHGWGNNSGGGDTFPTLKNPYLPDSAKFTMVGEKGVDVTSDDAHGQAGGNDTWPSLQNPYAKASDVPAANDDGGKVSYK
jgi:hypothetical protein